MARDQKERSFHELSREPSLSSQVVDKLENYIADMQLRPGDRLPSERELGRQLGVSRTVIREAVRALMARGLLDVRAGSGTLVRAPSPESVSKSVALLLQMRDVPLDYGKIHEVRRLLEIEIVGLAAERRSDEDLKRLDVLVDEMSHIQGDRDRFAQNDVAFHITLAEAAHNELFVVLLDSLSDIMVEVRRTGFAIPGAPQHAIDYHRQISEQVRTQNVKKARALMKEHLSTSEQIFRAGQTLNTPTD